jgi:cholest-4-en-3-one 26-monooxygenase
MTKGGFAVDDINLLDLDEFTKGFPHHWFTWLRQHDPVHFHPEPDGPGFWVISKYDDIVKVSRATDVFSSDADNGGIVGLDRQSVRMHGEANKRAKSFMVMDPPAHSRARGLVGRGLTPRSVALLEPRIRSVVGALLDRGLQAGEVDWVPSVAAELPLQTIAELVGVPEEDRSRVFAYANRLIGRDDPEYRVADNELSEANMELWRYAQGLCEQRRQKPADDIITVLLNAELEGSRLTVEEINLTFVALIIAGSDTTRNTLSHGVCQLAQHPDQYAALVADPALIPVAVEEFLRWASPVLYFGRTAMEDVEIRGRKIPAGARVSIWYPSGNRDEDVFPDPFRFDIYRRPNDHVAFGRGGPHFCLGPSLARMQLRVLFEELVSRVAGIEMLGEPSYLRSNLLGGIKHLHVRLTEGARERQTT